MKFVISGSELVEIDTLFAQCQNFIFGGHFDFFRKRVSPYRQKLPTDFADFQWQTLEDNFVPYVQI